MVDALRSQQTWFSYKVCHMMGVVDALNINGMLEDVVKLMSIMSIDELHVD